MANRTEVATPVSLSLPSFAQAFSSSSINSISNTGNALPPIHSHSRSSSPAFISRRVSSTPLNEDSDRPDRNNRKRTFREASESAPEPPQSPVSIKQEPDRDEVNQSSPSRSYQWSANEAPVPSSTKPFTTAKRRRVTISGINTDLKRPTSSDANTPISPVVMGFTIMRDDPCAIEQVRSMLNVKQQQKALIEHRRSSNAGLPGTASPNAPPTIHVFNGIDTRHSSASRRSPNASATNSRRLVTATGANGPRTSPPSSTPQQQSQPEPPAATPNVLPEPPISFAHRRASRLGAKSKPADIMISPREVQSSEQMQPSIMSAPPVSQGRFSMALPSLPQAVLSGKTLSRVTSSVVPPTPTRLGGPRTAIPTFGAQISMTTRSPPTASVPISATLVPPTPSSLHRPSYASEKTAFLAPFEMFYDALTDSKQLKTWLGEQLQKSNALVSSLQKHDNLEELVDSLVEKKISGIREEVYGLRRKVGELETALRIAQGAAGAKGKGRATEYTPEASESYTFPPVPAGGARKPEYAKHVASPSRADASAPESQGNSPAPYESNRQSVSSARFEPRPGPSAEWSRDPTGVREGIFSPAIPHPPSMSSSNSSSHRNDRSPTISKPQLRRTHSHSSNAQSPLHSGQQRRIRAAEQMRDCETPEDFSSAENGVKRGGFVSSTASPHHNHLQHGAREELRRGSVTGILSHAGRHRSNSSAAGS